ncbi:MAG: tetratricopeptide repeat protein [Bryobacteraceae bacterium]
MDRGLPVAFGLLMLGGYARAEKKITVKIAHSPSLGATLTGKVVTPGPLTGDCAKEFGDLVFQDMRGHGVAMTGGANSNATATPAIIVSIDVSRCEARPLPAMVGEGLPAVHISRTEGWLVAQVRAVDAVNGHELAAATVHGHAQKDNESQSTVAEWPAPSEVKSMALRQGVAEAQRLYAPWTETREIPFMDSKECHLKQAFDTAKAGDYEALVKLSRANAESCGTGSKAAMEAQYNLGVACFLVRQYDDAVSAFEKVAGLNGGKLVAGLMEESRRESAAVKALQPKAVPVAQGPPVQTGMVMTNDLVIKLIDGNVAEEEVLKMIANQPGRFSLEPADVARLKAAGVPESVIAAMRNKK